MSQLRILVTGSPELDLTTPCIPPPRDASPNGNGYYRMPGNREYAHRAAYREHKGPIPTGMTVDHVCHTEALDECPGGAECPHRRCCNPLHLEVVSHVENCLRGGSPPADNARKVRCLAGHEYVASPLGERRRCEECRRARRQEIGEISAKGRKVDRTHCPRDHEYTPENTYIARRVGKAGRVLEMRQCRACNTERARERRQARLSCLEGSA